MNIIMVTFTNKSLATPDVIRNLGMRFRDYRLRLRMTRKEVSEAASIGMTTLYRFESGNMTDISFSTLLKLLKTIGLERTGMHCCCPNCPNHLICIRTMRKRHNVFVIPRKNNYGHEILESQSMGAGNRTARVGLQPRDVHILHITLS